ncbi:DUF1620 domain-containing protein [Colletotrichum higginsianum]|nr:DUF1620 domain-containing protein [Colletotrichum higginsianum]
MGRLVHLGALACLYLGAESKALRWQDDTPSWVPPKQTIAAMNMEELGFSPRPTTAPDPANVELKLAKRTNSSASAQPECITYVYSGSDFNRYTLYGCAVSEQRVVVYANPTDSSVTDEATTSDPLARSIQPTASLTDTGALSPASSTASASGGSGSGGGGSSTPVGAIVGGVVGGVAAIALIVFGIIFLRRKKKKDAAANNTNSQAAPATYNGPPPPQQGQPQMYQQPMAPPTQQSSPGGYAPPPHPSQDSTYPQGFAPVDNRQSMLKQPYDVTTGSYEQTGVSPPASPPPLSPSPTYQSGVPQYVATQNAVSPTYPPPQQQQQQHQGSYYNAPPPPAQGQPAHPQQQYQQPGFTSELPTHRGDNELRELA